MTQGYSPPPAEAPAARRRRPRPAATPIPPGPTAPHPPMGRDPVRVAHHAPPLFLPDLRVGPSPRPFEDRGLLRRGAPERLRIEPRVRGTSRALTLAALGPAARAACRAGARLAAPPAPRPRAARPDAREPRAPRVDKAGRPR